MNATFTLEKAELKGRFDSMCADVNHGINGHPFCRGARASMYNALPLLFRRLWM